MSEFPEWVVGAGSGSAAVAALFLWGGRLLRFGQRFVLAYVESRLSAAEESVRRITDELQTGPGAIGPTVRRHDRQIAHINGRLGIESHEDS